jgi:hypothetical protein
MNKFYSLSFLIITLSCSPAKNNETAVDSTVVATDTTPAYTPPVYHPGPARNFPSFSQYAITENELENSITEALTEMLNQYDTGKYRTIKRDYSVYYKEPSDDDESTMDASETETKTWYFDSDNNLKAYTLEYAVKVGSSVNDPNNGSNIGEDETTIYLFSNSSSEDPTLIAIYNDKSVSYDFATSSKKRAVTSKCPKCGISLSYESEPTNDVEVLEQNDISSLLINFLAEQDALFAWLKEAEIKKDGENYIAKEELTHGETPYSADYTIDESLFEKLVKGNNQ